jgi:hypothetical protein
VKECSPRMLGLIPSIAKTKIQAKLLVISSMEWMQNIVLIMNNKRKCICV